MKKVLRVVTVIVVLVIYCVPLFGIYCISNKEKESYQLDDEYNIEKTAYGVPCEVSKIDMQEYYSYPGTIEGYKIVDVKVSGLKADKTSYICKTGDEIFKNQDIATDGRNTFKSPMNGIVQDIPYSKDGCVNVLSLDELCLNLSVPVDEVGVFENAIYDENGNKIKVIAKSNQVNENGEVSIKITNTFGDYLAGQSVNDIKIYTGYTYSNVYVVDVDCVYSKGKDNTYFVRKVDSKGKFIEEVEVGIGYSNGEYICITGLEEGEFCDDGYKDLVTSENKNEEAYEEFIQ